MSAWIKRVCLCTGALLALLQAVAVPLSATTVTGVPEINGSSVSAGLGLLAAGILILRSRRRSK
jgi:LPXTG-motif cell wall-anchored protein